MRVRSPLPHPWRWHWRRSWRVDARCPCRCLQVHVGWPDAAPSARPVNSNMPQSAHYTCIRNRPVYDHQRCITTPPDIIANSHLYDADATQLSATVASACELAITLPRRQLRRTVLVVNAKVTFAAVAHKHWSNNKKDKDTDAVLAIALLCDQKRFTTSEVAADWHELIIPQRTMRPSIAASANIWARGLQPADIPPPRSATLGLIISIIWSAGKAKNACKMWCWLKNI